MSATRTRRLPQSTARTATRKSYAHTHNPPKPLPANDLSPPTLLGQTLLVDPARCRLWPGAASAGQALDNPACRDLLAAIRRQGRQEVPAIVRRLHGDPTHEFEIVCGARRHWAVTRLRDAGLPHLGFLVEPRRLTDEQAFRLAEIDNRARRARPDHIRAAEYADAITRYYGGSQTRMADAIGLSQSRISRYLALNHLPPEITACFGGPARLRVDNVRRLNPLLSNPRARAAIIAAAAELTPEQDALRLFGQHLRGLDLAHHLADIGRRALGHRLPTTIIRSPAGTMIAKAKRDSLGNLVVTLPVAGTRNRPECLAALATLLDQLAGKAQSRPTPSPSPSQQPCPQRSAVQFVHLHDLVRTICPEPASAGD